MSLWGIAVVSERRANPIARIVLALVWPMPLFADADLQPIYLDSPGSGFYSSASPHAPSSAGGNPGATLGEQRRWALEKALEFWGLRLDSGVPVEVEVAMAGDMFCNSTSAVLASAGARTIHANWSPAAGGSSPSFVDTWHGQALANRIANKDNSPGAADIGATFNRRIDESTSCLGSTVWYYALGDAPPGTVSFIKTALHEIAHGLNVQTYVDLASGQKLTTSGGTPLDDIYMMFLEDHSISKIWPNMTDSERQASATDTNDLHWVGPDVVAQLGSLSDGVSGGHVEMYAPSPLEGGSSVSHWDVDVDDLNGNSELMEPSATGSEKLTVTDEMLSDMGWNDVAANNCAAAADRLTLTSVLSGTNQHDACVSVTYDGAAVDSGATTATAGQQVILRNGFSVRLGASFRAGTDPATGL
jgi:hypothetical protein